MDAYVTDGFCGVYVEPSPPVNVCDFTISPPAATATSCSGSKNTQNITALITPSESACHRQSNGAGTTCGASTPDGAIDGVMVTSCTDSLGPAMTVTYYAGPGTSGQKVGDLSVVERNLALLNAVTTRPT
jgi:hypothetical protein